MSSLPAVTRQSAPADQGTKRSTILEKAEVLFAARGFDGVSLDDIAVAVGLRRPSILHHFKSKREIYDAVESDIFASLNASQRSNGGEAAFDRLAGLLKSWLDFMVARPTAAHIIMRNTSDLVGRPNPIQHSDATIVELEEILRAGIASGEFRKIVSLQLIHLAGMPIISFVCNAGRLGDKRSYDFADPAVADEFFALLLETLRTLTQPAA